MSGKSSSAVEWFTRLAPANPAEGPVRRPGEPCLGEVVERWQCEPAALRPGRAVLVGFPQDEGVRRNHGRPGAAEAPPEIRRWLYRLMPWDARSGADLAADPPLDAGDVSLGGNLEATQEALAEVVAGILQAGAVPVVIGGGHETAYGHYLGYVRAGRAVGIINLDAHLDLRAPLPEGGHSGSPFRQALEHPTRPLPGERYVCLGAQPHAAGRALAEHARSRGCRVRWYPEVCRRLRVVLRNEIGRLARAGCSVYLTIDADAVRQADVPGVSAPAVQGLTGRQLCACARLAGRSKAVSSLDLVEINPRHDRDGQSARWAALVLWSFLVGRRLASGAAT